MNLENEWCEWVRFGKPLAPDALDAAMRSVSASLAEALKEVIVPLMTRCRAFPQILRLTAEYQKQGAKSLGVRQFMDRAPRDVRMAFDEIRRMKK